MNCVYMLCIHENKMYIILSSIKIFEENKEENFIFISNYELTDISKVQDKNTYLNYNMLPFLK